MTDNTITSFILEHYPLYRKWEADVPTWVKWHNEQGFIQCVLNDDQTLAGVSVSWPTMKDKPEKVDHEGNCIWVDLAIATKPYVIQCLIMAGLKRHGMRDWIAFKQAPYFVTKFYDAHKFRRVILRKETTYGQ